RPRQREVDVQLVGPRDDLGLAELDERGVDAEVALALDAGLGRQIGQLLERLRELRPAIGIAGVIDRIDADEDILGAQHFRPGEPTRGEDDGPGRDRPPRLAARGGAWRGGEKPAPWRLPASATPGERSRGASRRRASGWGRMRARGRAMRSASFRTSATSAS